MSTQAEDIKQSPEEEGRMRVMEKVSMDVSKGSGDIEYCEMERSIINVARDMFIERGYAETNMRDIADRMGIKRTVLYYYFRTKDRLFQAVFGSIVQSIVPTLTETMTHKEMPIGQRLAIAVDTYYKVFAQDPCLPLFVMRELQRDTDHFLGVVRKVTVARDIPNIFTCLLEEMDEGRLRRIPMHEMLYTFYGMLLIPFLTKPLCAKVEMTYGLPFDKIIEQWKPVIVSQMENLLTAK